MENEIFKLRGKKIEVVNREIDQSFLLFYNENPRIYSILNRLGKSPTQEEIYNQLIKMEHVKTLKSSIMSNDGIIDPLLVKDNGDNTYTVLEGNSRLAAIRSICSTTKNLAKWAMVKCKVFPSDMGEDSIFTLLGQYHLIGRKDWDAYEQASYLYRRMKTTKLPAEYMAKELGLTVGSVKKMINAIAFMEKYNDDDKKHFSYYNDVYLSSKEIGKYRDVFPQMDEYVVSQVKEDKIHDSKDFRKLKDIAKLGDKKSKQIMQEFASGKIDLYEAYDRMKQTGKLEDCVQKFKRFRKWLSDENDLLKEIQSSPEVQKDARFQIEKITQQLQRIKKKIDANN